MTDKKLRLISGEKKIVEHDGNLGGKFSRSIILYRCAEMLRISMNRSLMRSSLDKTP